MAGSLAQASVDTDAESECGMMGDMTITEFLLARIAEDEELLNWGRPLRIHVDPGGNGDASFPFHDRWKAECEAKRQAIDAAWGDHHQIEGEWGSCQSIEEMDSKGDVPGVVTALASVYADHPDFNEEWRG